MTTRWLASCSAVLAGVLCGASVRAMEFVPGWSGQIAWDSNVFQTADDEIDDFSIRTGPNLELRDRRGDFTFHLRYRPRYETYIETDDVDGFEHFVSGAGQWQITRRTRVLWDQNFARTATANRFFTTEALPSGEAGTGEFLFRRNGTTVNRTTLQLVHSLSPVTRMSVVAAGDIYEFDQQTASDARAGAVTVNLTRSLSPRLTLGVGATLRRQEFEEVEERREEGGTTFYEGSLLLDYQVSPTVSLSLSAGPAWVQPDDVATVRAARRNPTFGNLLVNANTCPQLPSGERIFGGACQVLLPVVDLETGDVGFQPVGVRTETIPTVDVDYVDDAPDADSNLTFFARAALLKEWDRARFRLFYQRRASSSSGIGASTNLDTVSSSFTWEPARLWQFSLMAQWNRQVSASDLPINDLVVVPSSVFLDESLGIVTDPDEARFRVDNAAMASGLHVREFTDNAIDITTYLVSLRGSRRIGRDIFVDGRIWWSRQETDGTVFARDTVHDARVELGITWTLDPIPISF